ncbi:MAG: hypothetical protein WD314_10975 [Trueperaceae bacterium]
MADVRARERVSLAGYALGVGLAFVPLIGIPIRFMLPETPALLSYSGALALGLLTGALVGWRRGMRA